MSDDNATIGGRGRLGLIQRPRRNRRSDWTRRLVRETRLDVDNLIWPLFLVDGEGRQEPVPSMPEVCRYSIDRATEAIKYAASLGIPAVALFPNIDPALRDAQGSQALDPLNLVCRACRAIKAAAPEIGVITDVASFYHLPSSVLRHAKHKVRCGFPRDCFPADPVVIYPPPPSSRT